ncbi:MAG: PIN domain-containing protein [Gemmatimonadota bacterium]
MSTSFSRAPHIEGAGVPVHSPQAPNAALLIDFDNVTMGMRSDLSKELKTLLSSDVIKGKVTVQRAYADWRRYPQYIVPLSEASIDLIFAPAYGSSKKNATDIRMAIDGIELVFTRPEIGTYILLTGDSDFSSLVLKLKEYGKYVIGVGIQESSSDILVQNCDEYYSYTSLSGLRKTDEHGSSPTDPWALVERAVEQMGKRGDVMRSDRLKQVMLEIDPGFDEKGLGFNKFSRFLSEAGKKGLIVLQKMENGQYEILPGRGGRKPDERRVGAPSEGRRSERGRSGRGRSTPSSESGSRGRSAGSDQVDGDSATPPSAPVEATTGQGSASAGTTGTSTPDSGALEAAYSLLRRAISELLQDDEGDSVRDSDVKRRMLALDSEFDEGTMGYPKFSRFLLQAQDHEVVVLQKTEGGNYQVGLGTRMAPPEETRTVEAERPKRDESEPRPTTATPSATTESPQTSGRLRPREATVSGRSAGDEPPPLFAGQVVVRGSSEGKSNDSGAARPSAHAAAGPTGTVIDPVALRLPTGAESVVQYLTNSYGGVGKKTAETLVEALGERLFVELQKDPQKVAELLPPARAEKLLEGWHADLRRRKDRYGGGDAAPPLPDSAPVGGDPDRASEEEAESGGDDVSGAPRGRPRRTRSGR